MVGLATDKHQAPTHRFKLYVRAIIESKAWPTVVQLKGKPKLQTMIGFKTRHASNPYRTFNNLFELITKIRFSNNSFEFIN